MFAISPMSTTRPFEPTPNNLSFIDARDLASSAQFASRHYLLPAKLPPTLSLAGPTAPIGFCPAPRVPGLLPKSGSNSTGPMASTANSPASATAAKSSHPQKNGL